MSVDRVDKGMDTQQLMQILEAGQSQSIDLAKKIVKVAHLEGSLKNVVEGIGQNIDILA